MKKILILFIISCFLLTGCNKYETENYELLDEKTVLETKTTSYFLGDMQYMDNTEVINSLKEKDINVITIPIAWSEVEKVAGEYTFDSYKPILNQYIANGFKFILILDTAGRVMVNGEDEIVLNEDGSIKTSLPTFILESYDDELMENFYGEKVSSLDFVEGESKKKIEQFYDASLTFFKENYADDIESISPGIMNEFEFKYPQNNYKWTSYSEANKEKFITYLSRKYVDVNSLNEKTGSTYNDLEEVSLPVIDYNNTIENSDFQDDPLFVDFMEFREDMLVNYATPLINKIKQADFKAIGYFGQLYHPQDAIYATHIIEKSTSLFDIIVVDYNFYDGYSEVYNAMIPAFLTNYAKNLGYEKVYTGIYVERIKFEENIDFLQTCLDNISNDNNSNGTEVGNVRPISKIKNLPLDFYKASKLKNDYKIGMYFSKWNTYKTHGESKDNINYFTNSFMNMMDIVQNKLGYSVDVMSDSVVIANIDEYDLVIVPAQIIVNQDVQNAFAKFKDNGGKILIDYRFAEFNEYGKATVLPELPLYENIKGFQAINEDKTIKSSTISKLKIHKNEANLPNLYYMATDKENNMFSDGDGNNIGYKDDDLIILGFQPQMLYSETKDEVYIEVIDDCIQALLK